MRVLDLFSGIGGMALGLEAAGMETVGFCEIDPFCRKVLRRRFPAVPLFEDVRKLKGTECGPVDVVAGGYPCQPYSVAGRREGAEDDRALWPEMARIVDAARPAWVLGENVAGHITLGLDGVLSDLEAKGYACRAFVVPACAVGAFHRRERVWVVAHAESQRQSRSRRAKRSLHRAADCAREGAQSLPILRWPDQPRVRRAANGVPDRAHRLKALGNAVVPQVVEVFGRAIMEADKS